VLIDWFTIVAQIVNFLVLILLLRRFLYRPILNAMQERERQVAERLESAAQERLQAEEERRRYEALNAELRKGYTQKQRQAEDEVDVWRKQALHDARLEVDDALHSWRRSLEQEKEAFGAELRQFAVRQAYAIAGQALRDLAEAPLEERMLELFLSRLEKNEIDLERFKDSARQGLTLYSAFELPEHAQARIRAALRSKLGQDVSLRFEIQPELEAGIELLSVDGYQAAWNLKRYLQALDDDLHSQLQQDNLKA
jgi:F-type H+-transporting ATPase subunit b